MPITCHDFCPSLHTAAAYLLHSEQRGVLLGLTQSAQQKLSVCAHWAGLAYSLPYSGMYVHKHMMLLYALLCVYAAAKPACSRFHFVRNKRCLLIDKLGCRQQRLVTHICVLFLAHVCLTFGTIVSHVWHNSVLFLAQCLCA